MAEHLEKLKRPKRYTWGTLDLDELMRRITLEGITDAKVEHIPAGCIIHLVSIFAYLSNSILGSSSSFLRLLYPQLYAMPIHSLL